MPESTPEPALQGAKKRGALLGDHRRLGKRLIPPLAVALQELERRGTKIHVLTWPEHLLPEFIWLALLVDQLGRDRAASPALEVTKTVSDATNRQLSLVSDFGHVPHSQRPTIRHRLKRNGSLPVLRKALGPLMRQYRDCPVTPLIGPRHSVMRMRLRDLKVMRHVMEQYEDRCSILSTHTQGIALACLSLTSPEFRDDRLGSLAKYPRTDESLEVASLARAKLNGVVARDSRWCRLFWIEAMRLAPCRRQDCADPLLSELLVQPGFRESALAAEIAWIRETRKWMCKGLASETSQIWLRDDSLANVGLITRLRMLCIQLVSAPNLWTADMTEVMLRLVLECYIVLAWFLKKATPADYRKFLEYGAGQDKLQRARLKLREGSAGEAPGKVSNTQPDDTRFDSVREVNLGYWLPGKNLRTLAAEAGLIELYDLLVSLCSESVHSTWGSLYRYCYECCSEPLHGSHALPLLDRKPPVTFIGVNLSTALLDDALRLWFQHLGIRPPKRSPSRRLALSLHRAAARRWNLDELTKGESGGHGK